MKATEKRAGRMFWSNGERKRIEEARNTQRQETNIIRKGINVASEGKG